MRGDAVVLIDADLQDPPEVIPAMVERWRAGYHVVYGARQSREGETYFKLVTAKLFYRLINMLSEFPIPLDTGDFRLMDRKVVVALNGMQEQGESLLERTMVLYGTCMGSANSHSNLNLPVLLAGGGFRHGQHLGFDQQNNYPLTNLFVSMLRRLGLDVDRFASSTGTMRGLELV